MVLVPPDNGGLPLPSTRIESSREGASSTWMYSGSRSLMFVRRGPAIVLSLVLGAAALLSVPSALASDGGARRTARPTRTPASGRRRLASSRSSPSTATAPPRGRSATVVQRRRRRRGTGSSGHNGERLRPGRRPRARASIDRLASGSRGTMLNFDGADDVVFRAENLRTGEVCRAVRRASDGPYPERHPTKGPPLESAPQPGHAVPGDRARHRRSRSSSAPTSSPTAPPPTRRSPRRARHDRGARRSRSSSRDVPRGLVAGDGSARRTARRLDREMPRPARGRRRRPGQRSGPRTARIVYSEREPRSIGRDVPARRGPATRSCSARASTGARGRPTSSRRRRTGCERRDADGAWSEIYTRIESPEGEPLLFEAYYSLDEIEAAPGRDLRAVPLDHARRRWSC